MSAVKIRNNHLVLGKGICGPSYVCKVLDFEAKAHTEKQENKTLENRMETGTMSGLMGVCIVRA